MKRKHLMKRSGAEYCRWSAHFKCRLSRHRISDYCRFNTRLTLPQHYRMSKSGYGPLISFHARLLSPRLLWRYVCLARTYLRTLQRAARGRKKAKQIKETESQFAFPRGDARPYGESGWSVASLCSCFFISLTSSRARCASLTASPAAHRASSAPYNSPHEAAEAEGTAFLVQLEVI